MTGAGRRGAHLGVASRCPRDTEVSAWEPLGTTTSCRGDSPFVTEKAVYEFRDVHDRLAKFFEAVEICREQVTSIMEIHLALLSNRIAAVGNRTNRVVGRLTRITTVFMPLTLLAGVGGMSEWSMMTGPQNWRVSYPVFMLLMAAVGAASYGLLRWLDARDRASGPEGVPAALDP